MLRTAHRCQNNQVDFDGPEILSRGESFVDVKTLVTTTAAIFVFVYMVMPRLVHLRLVARETRFSPGVKLELALRHCHAYQLNSVVCCDLVSD